MTFLNHSPDVSTAPGVCWNWYVTSMVFFPPPELFAPPAEPQAAVTVARDTTAAPRPSSRRGKRRRRSDWCMVVPRVLQVPVLFLTFPDAGSSLEGPAGERPAETAAGEEVEDDGGDAVEDRKRGETAVLDGAVTAEKLVDGDGDGQLRGGGQQDERDVEIRPSLDEVQHEHDQQAARHDREDDPYVALDPVRPVDPGRLLESRVNVVKEGLHQPDADRRGEGRHQQGDRQQGIEPVETPEELEERHDQRGHRDPGDEQHHEQETDPAPEP